MYLLARGADRSAPVLLWLHGGPGAAERPLFRYFNSELENHFVVVYWDQRGAGRSFDPKADPHRLTIAQHVADLDAVVDHLRQCLGQDKIILMGHSWGAALGLLYAQAHPDKVSAFIGVNPVVSTSEEQQAEYDFVLAEASRRKDNRALAHLRKIGPPPYKNAGQVLAMERLAQRYGGVFHQEPRRTWIMVRAIFTGLVTPWEIPRLIHANNVSLEAMNEELLGLDLARSVPGTGVPVLFFLGRYDRHADGKLAATYFATLRAPAKRLVWFEKSAHNVPFEEPRLFHATVVRELQLIGVRLAAGEGVQRQWLPIDCGID
jgi:pimeloyl-ACP methyl ester carboxylesterase